MADSVQNLSVKVTVDTSQLGTGLSNAQATVNQAMNGLKTSIASSTEAMSSAKAATDTLSESTHGLGEAVRETGSRRELGESLRLMRTSAMGTAEGFEVLQ